MAGELKRFFDAARVRRLASELAAAWPAFPRKRFERAATEGLDALELLDRGRHVMRALKSALPAAPEEALAILLRTLGPPLEATEGHGMEPFHYLPHVLFVAEHGHGCFEASMAAQHALTQRFSAEFSIRSFLEREPERTLARLRTWIDDPSEHVRRLVSEGTRPRLPWAGRLPAFQKDPAPVLALLERLKDDPSLYVRRSVANSLNDVGKDHPALLVDVARRWLEGATPERRWLVEHALRSLVKRGDAGALEALGYGKPARVELLAARVTPPRPRIGDRIEIVVELAHRGRTAVDAVIDLGLHFVKARGATALKVFKLRALRLAPSARITLTKRISLAQHTTRTHHPGRHAFDVRVNGRVLPAGAFVLRPA